MSLALALKQYRELSKPGVEFYVGDDRDPSEELSLSEQLALAEEEEVLSEEADRAIFGY